MNEYLGTDLAQPEIRLAVVVVHDAAAVGHAAGVDDDGGGGVGDADVVGWMTWFCGEKGLIDGSSFFLLLLDICIHRHR